MVKGQHFGEISIMTNQRRGATIVAQTNLHLGVLMAGDFKSIFEKIYMEMNFTLGILKQLMPL